MIGPAWHRMNPSGHEVWVAGAGVLGLSIALSLQSQGIYARVFDPEPEGANASAVAAGLLAPISEAVLDPAAAPHFALLNAALAEWPAFAHTHGIQIDTEGSVLLGGPDRWRAALGLLGAEGRPTPDGMWVADPRIADPVGALKAMRAALKIPVEHRALSPSVEDGQLLVIAAGPGAVAWGAVIPELEHLSPVKGQIAVAPHGLLRGPTLRWSGGYLAPQPDGARIGATMETGRSDRVVESEVIQALASAALSHAPDLDLRDLHGQAGVRMETRDGLPLVGPARRPNTFLAVGARRNGWLLAPLVGRIIAAYVTGKDPGPWAQALHPGRFDP